MSCPLTSCIFLVFSASIVYPTKCAILVPGGGLVEEMPFQRASGLEVETVEVLEEVDSGPPLGSHPVVQSNCSTVNSDGSTTNVSRTENVVTGEKVENKEQAKPEGKKPEKKPDDHSRTLNIVLGVSLGLIAFAMSMIAITMCLLCSRRHELNVFQTAPPESSSASSVPVKTEVVTVQPPPVANPRSLEEMK